jgi:tetratricopeptide (TPR) repeat protein
MLILANLYFELGNMSDAEKMYRKSLKLFKKVDATSFNCANACHCFGLYCREKGRKVEAERSFSDAYDIFNKHYPGSLEGAQNMLSMGMLYQDMGRRDAAVSFVSGALECWRRCGIEKPDVEALLMKMRSEPR